jgi:hypothetical protein
MNSVTIRGVKFNIGFHFADSSFKKVVDATELFSNNKSFVLINNDKTDFIIYLPDYKCTVDVGETIQYASVEQMQMKLGIDLMCFDLVLPIESVDTFITDLKLIG